MFTALYESGTTYIFTEHTFCNNSVHVWQRFMFGKDLFRRIFCQFTRFPLQYRLQIEV